MTDDDELIECATHGETPPVFACKHVSRGVACGFWTPVEDDVEAARPSAWCDACEEVANANGGWPDDYALENMKLLCTHCWDAAKERNSTVPPKARGERARLTPAEQQDLIHHAVHELQAKQAKIGARWKIGGESALEAGRWDYNIDEQTMTFSEGGQPRVVADMRAVGSYAETSKTFQWYWHTLGERNHPVVSDVTDLEGFGLVRGIERLTKVWWECDLQEGWEMTALAAYLLEAEAGYRAPTADGMYLYMLLDNFRAVS